MVSIKTAMLLNLYFIILVQNTKIIHGVENVWKHHFSFRGVTDKNFDLPYWYTMVLPNFCA